MPAFSNSFNVSSLNGKNGFTIVGAGQYDAIGLAVASAGDINGDGFDDLMIGAPNASDDLFENPLNGKAIVIFGYDGGFASTLDLSFLPKSYGFTMSAFAGYSLLGASLASAGDINGDGFADMIVAAPDTDTSGSGSGAVFVIFGKASGFNSHLNLDRLAARDGFRIDGLWAHQKLGENVDTAGDINGDGFDDFIISSVGGQNSRAKPAESYVVFGKKSGFGSSLDLAKLDGKTGFAIIDETRKDPGDMRTASAGDINGDGFDDLFISVDAPDLNKQTSALGYVVFGKKSGFASSLELAKLDGKTGFEIRQTDGKYYYNLAIAGAGDVNGDGYDDLIIGTRSKSSKTAAGQDAFIVFGKKSGFAANFDIGDLNGKNGFKITAPEKDGRLGQSVAGAGDINGDGYDDIILSGHRRDAKNVYHSESYVIFGRKSGFSATLATDKIKDSIGFRIENNNAKGNRDAVVNSAGDLNGDGFDDIVIGDYQATGGFYNTGATYVIYGHANGVLNRTGTSGRDTLSGGEWNDSFKGMAGNDWIRAGAGKDRIDGGTGADKIAGGAGQDKLTGGSGADTFVFARGDTAASKAGADTIYDFSGSGGDHIDLRQIDANSGKSGNPAFTFHGTAAFTKHAGELRYEKLASDTYISGDTNGDGKADFIIHLDDSLTLKADHFLL